MYIQICSLKMLYHLLRESAVDITTACAIIVASETPLRPQILGQLDYLYAPFADVTQGEGILTPQTARKIAVYFDDLTETCERLFICCDAGESRSAAVAAALLRAEGRDDKKLIWCKAKYHPNPHVYRTLCQVYGIRISALEIRRLVRINKKALKKSISQSRH